MDPRYQYQIRREAGLSQEEAGAAVTVLARAVCPQMNTEGFARLFAEEDAEALRMEAVRAEIAAAPVDKTARRHKGVGGDDGITAQELVNEARLNGGKNLTVHVCGWNAWANFSGGAYQGWREVQIRERGHYIPIVGMAFSTSKAAEELALELNALLG